LTWLKGRAPGYSKHDPFPDYIDAEELDGRLDNLAQQLEALDPAFNLQKFVNGKALLKELGKKKSISFFIARIYFYALKACSLKAWRHGPCWFETAVGGRRVGWLRVVASMGRCGVSRETS
jgi:hypothetical protein